MTDRSHGHKMIGTQIEPFVPIIILNFNGWRDSFAVVEAVASEGFPVWLVDNGSDEDRSQEAMARFPALKIMRLARNLGWAGGYNAALGEAAREGAAYAYILNSDAFPRPGAVAAAVAALRARPDVAAVGSIIMEGFTSDVWFDGDYVNPPLRRPLSQLDTSIRQVETINGAAFALRLQAWSELPICEDYFLYHEETDWAWAVRRHGWHLMVAGTSLVNHERKSSDTNNNAQYYLTRNLFLARRRRLDGGDTEVSSVITLAMAQIEEALRREKHAKSAAIHGLIDGLRGRFGKRGPELRPRLVLVLDPTLRLLAALARLRRGWLAIGRRLSSPSERPRLAEVGDGAQHDGG